MSITHEDVKKLANLSRIKLTDDEIGRFTKEIDSILGYVEQIKEVAVSGDSSQSQGQTLDKVPKQAYRQVPDHRNVLRDDIADMDINPDPLEVLECAPNHQDGFIKVKKILG
jgi:aspartyl-tRNA(Asn)/glutamyl-tRNA(Gln) amidotransferase subunit C